MEEKKESEEFAMQKTDMQELRIVDNFYQTSSYFPMPTLLIGTLTEDGRQVSALIRFVFPSMWRERNIMR